MLDTNLLRKDLDSVIARLNTRKNPQPFLDEAHFRALEAERKAVQTRTEELQARRNSLSKQIGMAKGKGEDASALMAEVGSIADELKAGAERLEAIQADLAGRLMSVPNLPQSSVPVGADETGNVEVRRWGAPKTFDFTVKDHVDLGEPLGLDFETGAKLSGSRFSFLKGPVARLHRALAQFMLDVHTREHGYTEVYVPYMVNSDAANGVSSLASAYTPTARSTSYSGIGTGTAKTRPASMGAVPVLVAAGTGVVVGAAVSRNGSYGRYSSSWGGG